eukprot:4393532-Amphidinium_carterae.1
MTWQALGGPPRGMGARVLGEELSPMQASCVAAHRDHWRSICRAAGDDSSTVAGGTKLQYLLEQLRCGAGAGGYGIPQQHHQVTTESPSATITLTDKNLALPKAAAQIPLKAPVVPQFFESILEEPGVFTLPEDQRPKAPRACWQVSNWKAVANRLCESGMMELRRHDHQALRA